MPNDPPQVRCETRAERPCSPLSPESQPSPEGQLSPEPESSLEQSPEPDRPRVSLGSFVFALGLLLCPVLAFVGLVAIQPPHDQNWNVIAAEREEGNSAALSLTLVMNDGRVMPLTNFFAAFSIDALSCVARGLEDNPPLVSPATADGESH
jgi:hypothetical protein